MVLGRLRKAVKNGVRTVRNAAMDLRYGGWSGGYIRNPNPGATGISATDYGLMGQIFADRIRPTDVLVDAGCGKGRVINWWLHQGLRNKMYGLELVPDVAEHTRRRLRKYANVTIVTGDAIENLPPEATVYFLGNPFDWASVVTSFKDRLLEVCTRKAEVKVIYFAPIHLDVFKADPRWRIEEISLVLPEAGRFEERHRTVAIITAA